MSLPRDDLDLIDALVWAGCLTRAAAKEVAAHAQPGRVATCIHEKGLAPAIQPPQVIVRALLKAEQAFGKVARSVRPEVQLSDYDPRRDDHCSCGGSASSYDSCSVHGEWHRAVSDQPETD